MLGFMQTRPPATAARIEEKTSRLSRAKPFCRLHCDRIDSPTAAEWVAAARACKLVSGNVRELTETGYPSPPKNSKSEPSSASPRRSAMWRSRSSSPRPSRVRWWPSPSSPTTSRGSMCSSTVSSTTGRASSRRSRSTPCPTTPSYSFATAPSDDGQVSFFIRRVPEGHFSTLVNDTDVSGTGSSSRAHRRVLPSRGPCTALFVAGGSGLAPIMAILEDALAQGVERPVTVLFGARAQRDLYGMAQLERIAAA